MAMDGQMSDSLVSRLLAGHFISILLAQWTLHLHCLDPLSARTARTEGAPGANTTRHIRFEPTAVSPPDISRPSAEPGETARGPPMCEDPVWSQRTWKQVDKHPSPSGLRHQRLA
ncbi:uncharacterized protein LOC112570599 [Pomacea canaliculata]|uniref:uncharacterized protein LOC112570599 n=1 Tax=Pomacea canaliculata TaxID=400727 RepID=UPI000D72B91F|nr:uncharacterized protein LOC112570599 [Pomacea canaliculata]